MMNNKGMNTLFSANISISWAIIFHLLIVSFHSLITQMTCDLLLRRLVVLVSLHKGDLYASFALLDICRLVL